MPNWDYSGNGIYFLSIITQNRICNLGNIINKKMILSDYGKIVETEFLKSFEIRNELFLDEFIIMPNHLHTIVVLNKPEIDIDSNRANLQSIEQSEPLKLIRLPKSISSFMAGFKSSINSKIDDFIDDNQLNIPKYNRNNHFFQSNYHDHIIRNNTEFERIKNYIINNPANWENDKFNTENTQ
jgi:REP element-mobilizing transposase RayT